MATPLNVAERVGRRGRPPLGKENVIRGSRFWALAAAAGLVMLPLGGAPQARADAGGATRIEYVLDSSGSMSAPDRAGRPKIDAAREALNTMADGLDPGSLAGMRVYGATVVVQDPDNPPSGACQDTQQVVGIATGNRQQLHDAINRYRPTGYTPTVQALTAAAADLGKEGNRHIVLVSDGEANCSPDPCGDVKKLRDSGVTIQVDTVGMSLDDKAREQLRCMAAATGGTYYDTGNTQDLTNSLQRITQRALRGYDFQGAPVSGSAERASGPHLSAGQYLDSMTGKQVNYYTVTAPANGSLHVSAVAKPTNHDTVALGALRLSLETQSGSPCAWGSSNNALDATGDANPILLASAVVDPIQTARNFTSDGCRPGDAVVVKLERDSSSSPEATPVEIRVEEAPFPTNVVVTGSPSSFPDLPAAKSVVDREADLPEPPTGAPTMQVVGGTSLNSAVALKPGVTSDAMQIGETVVYETHLGWNQDAALFVTTDSDTPADADVQAVGPHRRGVDLPWTLKPPLAASATLGGNDGKSASIGAYVPPVRANNVFMNAGASDSFADPGDVYFIVNVSRRWGDRTTGNTVPLRLALVVRGQAGGGVPRYDGSVGQSASASASAAPAAGASGDTTATSGPPSPRPSAAAGEERQPRGQVPAALWIGAGALGAALVAAGAGLLVARRRQR